MTPTEILDLRQLAKERVGFESTASARGAGMSRPSRRVISSPV